MATQRYKNSPDHIQFARDLRRQAPLAERLLWQALSSMNATTGLKFRRQHPLHPYVADFACIKARLIVELDGMSHDARFRYDAARNAVLAKKGWTILRFANDEVYSNVDGVVTAITTRAKELLLKRD